MSRIATAIVFGCAIVLASGESFARGKIRFSMPSFSKPAAAAVPPKGVTTQPTRGGGTFVYVGGVRPFAAASGQPQRVLPENDDPVRFAAGDVKAPETKPAATEPAEIQAPATETPPATQPVSEPAKAEPAPAPIRVTAASKSAAPDAPRRQAQTIVCYVQLSGACVPF